MKNVLKIRKRSSQVFTPPDVSYVWLKDIEVRPELHRTYVEHSELDIPSQLALSILSSIVTHASANVAISPLSVVGLAKRDPNRLTPIPRFSYSDFKDALARLCDEGILIQVTGSCYRVDSQILQK